MILAGKTKLLNFLNANVTANVTDVTSFLSFSFQAVCVGVNLQLAKAIGFSLPS